MKKFVKIIALSLCAVLVMLNLSGFTSSAIIDEKSSLEMEEKIICKANIDDDFDDNCVLVILDKSVGGINKKIDESLFKDVDISNIKDLTYMESFDAEKFVEINAARKSGKTVKTEEMVYDIDPDKFRQILKLELKTKSKSNVLKVVSQLEKVEGIKYAGPSFNDKYCSTSDTYFSDQYALQEDYLNIEAAWEITIGSPSVKVGIMDSGIAEHEDLAVNLSTGYDFYFGTNVTTDDLEGHGTFVAGIIGATCDNGKGISGVCKRVTLVPLQVDNGYGTPSSFAQVEAITYAINNQISILNYSGGFYGENALLSQAIANYPGLYVCAADHICKDNDGDDPHFPSSYEYDNIIAVSASDSDGEHWSLSNYGATSVDLAAPGEGIWSTIPIDMDLYDDVIDGYTWYDGTSFATPYVTGVAALMLSANPDLTPLQIKEIILATVDKNETLEGKCVSGGTLNAYEAVRRANTYTVFDQPDYRGGYAFNDTNTPWFETTHSGRVWPGDIDGDGKTDLMGIDVNGNICCITSKGDGSFNSKRTITVTSSFSSSWFSNSYNQRVWVDDFDGDGDDDFMGISVAGKMYTMENNGNYTFGPLTMSSTGTAFRSESAWFSTTHSGRVWTGDVDGDNDADFIGISGDGHVYYAKGDGNGNFSSETKITMTNGFAQSWFTSSYRSRVWVADVNADGYDDFIGVSDAGGIYTSLNNGNYTFTTPTNRGTCSFSAQTGWFSTNYTSRVWPADVDNNGRCDLVGINVAGDVYIQVANSTGTAFTQKKVYVKNGYGSAWFSNTRRQYLWPADLNRDGRVDFVGINVNGNSCTSLQSKYFN